MENWFCPMCGFVGSDPECPKKCPRCGYRAEKYECAECNYVGYFLGTQPEFCPSCGEELTEIENEDELIDELEEDIYITRGEEESDEEEDDVVEELETEEEDELDELDDEEESQELDFESRGFSDEYL